MNFHDFTYNQQMILFYTILVIVAMAIAFLLAAAQNKRSKNNNKEIPWDTILQQQTIALAVKSLVDVGELTITVKDKYYAATLRSQLGFKTRTDGFELHKVLKSLDHETTIKLIQMTTKTGD